jgi:hypothetical protein
MESDQRYQFYIRKLPFRERLLRPSRRIVALM